MHNKKVFILLGAVLFQLVIIAGMIGKSLYPLVTGTEVRLKTEPRDPRDLLRGDYVVLNYQFSNIRLKPSHERGNVEYFRGKHDLVANDVFFFGDFSLHSIENQRQSI